ncbi:glycosyltransferase [Vibrio cyclitrophicus]|uniref:glycosyltransferase family 2 protein n=1 Tax=Vibrio cyclitrophicus TaxID=47951 RepID=UPI00206E3031|nr:glycosyltransferase [Vibrio cyclitrophicus]UPR26468.1 glycosyltransferase [Vibrio cyclitrophicus]
MISIITATFNSDKEILQTYESIKCQSFSDWEWIITDDCSTDNTLSILERISTDDPRVRVFVNDKNSGAAVSRNNSMCNASGDLLAFIDSDDIWLPTKLSEQKAFMDDNRINFSFSAYDLIDEYSKFKGKVVDSTQEGSFGYHDMLKKKATLGCSTVMIRKSAFSDISMPLLRTGQDYATWLKLLKTGEFAYIYPKVLTRYRIRSNSISRNKFKKSLRQWEIYRKVEKLSLFYSVYCFLHYAWRAIFRK